MYPGARAGSDCKPVSLPGRGTTLQGTAGWGGTVTRPTVQSACNQFEIGQNNKTQEQHSDDVYTLYTEAGHSGGIKSFSLSPAGQGGVESCRHPGDTTYDSLDWFGGVTINHSTI